MRSINFTLLFAAVAVFGLSSCFYDPDRSKIADEDAGVEDAGPVDAGAASDWPWSGLGMACTNGGEECAEYDADYCLADPNNADEPGRCTVKQCDLKGCPDLYQCCDCSLLGMEIMCVPDGYAELISAYCQCS